jgi:superfamily II DNA or RNA helicase
MSIVAFDDAAIRQDIAQRSIELRHASALEELALIHMESLNANKEGIRISALKNVGIVNMAQICMMPVGHLTNINGIGEQSARKIKQIADAMYNAVIASARVRINPEGRSQQQDALLQKLYILRNGEASRARLRSLLSYEHNISTALRDIRPCTGGLRWFFSSNSKKQLAVKAYQHLNYLLLGGFGSDAQPCLAAYDAVVRQSLSDCYADFEQNAVAYYSLLEGLGLNMPATAAAGLPDELVAAIERYPLDLKYMRTELRHYQAFGAKYILHQRKVLLGDEMGLGKTIQALAAIADLKAKGETHFLVVCPASVLVNWKRETEKHTDISSIIIHGWDKDLELDQWRREGGVGITNYETLLKLADILVADAPGFRYGMMVVDEAHFVKNPEAQRTKALLTASKLTDRVLYMTGTPLENRVEEMCFLVGCLRLDIANKLSTMKTLSATQKFKNELAPIYLRRVRDDVLTELPDLIESEDWLEPTDAELSAYFAAVNSENFMAMRRVSWDVDAAASQKAGRLMELCDDAQEDGRKVLVFSFFRDTLSKVCNMLGERALGPITGDVPTDKRQALIDQFTAAESGKVLVAQVQAGGVGLNIQSASVVIFCEPQIKPSLETQAISRAYRMGQVHDVQVHRLLCVDTIDEQMMEMLRGKQAEFDTYADESVVGTESLKETADDTSDSAWIKELIEQEKARISGLQEGCKGRVARGSA